MSFPPAPEEPSKPSALGINPYAAPEAELTEVPISGSTDLARAEAIRRAHIAHETSIRSIGTLQLLGALLTTLGLVGLLVAISSTASAQGGGGGLAVAGAAMAAYLVIVTVLLVATGIGLRRLRPWARWIDVTLIGLSLFANLVSLVITSVADSAPFGRGVGYTFGSSIIPAYFLYLLVSPKARVVFSPEYKQIIAQTPHIKMRTSCVVKGVLILVVTLVVFAIAAALFRVAQRGTP